MAILGPGQVMRESERNGGAAQAQTQLCNSFPNPAMIMVMVILMMIGDGDGDDIFSARMGEHGRSVDYFDDHHLGLSFEINSRS